MTEQTSKHPWSDAWLLHAVIIAAPGGTAELARVIGAADFLNHAILTFDELRGGVERLARGGWITLEDGRLGATPRARQRYDTLQGKRREPVELWQVLLADAPGAVVEGAEPLGPCQADSLCAAEVDRAVQQYLRRMKSR